MACRFPPLLPRVVVILLLLQLHKGSPCLGSLRPPELFQKVCPSGLILFQTVQNCLMDTTNSIDRQGPLYVVSRPYKVAMI